MEYQSQESLGHQQNKATGELALDLIAPIVNVMWNKWPMSLLGISGRHWSSSSSHSADWRVIHHHHRSLSIPCSTSLFFFVALVTLTVTATTGAAATATAGRSGGGGSSNIDDHDQEQEYPQPYWDFLLRSGNNSTETIKTRNETIITKVPQCLDNVLDQVVLFLYIYMIVLMGLYSCGFLFYSMGCCNRDPNPLPTYAEAVRNQVVDDINSLPLLANEQNQQQIHFENESPAPVPSAVIHLIHPNPNNPAETAASTAQLPMDPLSVNEC